MVRKMGDFFALCLMMYTCVTHTRTHTQPEEETPSKDEL